MGGLVGGFIATFVRMCVSNFLLTLGRLPIMTSIRDCLLIAHKSRDLRVMLSFKPTGFLVFISNC